MQARFIAATASVAALLTLAGAQAQAQNNRSFVSGQGQDTNPCTLANPCRTFAQALSQTNAGGEIAVLDTAGYGAVAITKSVTITNPGGVEAGVIASGQDAIQINAGTSSINVTLRGLTLQGAAGNGASGINWVSGGGTLNVIDCVTENFARNGIVIEPAIGSPNLNITINNTKILNNMDGIVINANNVTPVHYSISHIIANDNAGTGISIIGGFSFGSISFSNVEMNVAGLLYNSAEGVLTMVNSVFSDVSNGTGPGTTFYLYDANTIGSFSLAPGAITKTDGTNNIVAITGGGSLTKVAPQ